MQLRVEVGKNLGLLLECKAGCFKQAMFRCNFVEITAPARGRDFYATLSIAVTTVPPS